MLTVALSFVSVSIACDHVEVAAPGVSVEVADCEDEGAPVATMVGDEDEGGDPVDDGRSGQGLALQYGMHFLPEVPGHHLSARLSGEQDAYLSGELRYTPGSDVLGVGRLGAGFDVLGRGDWDLTLGLFLGGAGEWDRSRPEVATLYAAPIVGTEVAFGIDGRHLFGKYRWLAGIGGGPVDELLTENELTLGYKITPGVHVFGQYLLLAPGELDNQSGVGLGVRVAL